MRNDEYYSFYDVFDDILYHYGMPRHSGRYPWGSGEDPYQHSGDFVSRVQAYKKSGMKETDIAQAVGCRNTADLRMRYSKELTARRADMVAKAVSLKEDGLSAAEASRRMGIRESSYRSLLDSRSRERMNAARNTSGELKKLVDEYGIIDVGKGVEREMGISREKLKQACDILVKEGGYVRYGRKVHQANNPEHSTTLDLLCKPGTEMKEIYEPGAIHSVKDYVLRYDDDGREIIERKFEYPASMDSKRLMIRYRDDVAPDGHTGVEKDGTVEIRRGCKDLSLGESTYAQVRILVDGDKYIKGMAFYSDDLPPGKDVVFNTNKTRDQADKVLKPIKDDPENPFGSALRETGGQYKYTDENGERKLGLINKTRQEGDWGDWADSLPAQFLSKQPMTMINKQLDLAKSDKKLEFDEICQLTNPTVKRTLLESFASDCDSAAVHLKAAALPRQKYQVILPISTLKDDEIYAPRYQDGETVALIRYPHGGTFEIPILKVNNKHPDARKVMGTTPADAVGINSNVAERLSGADFDGDTVMVIPCNSPYSKTKVTSTRPLEKLVGFDPKMEYPERPGMKYMKYEVTDKDGHTKTVDMTQKEMGAISNLITDMTLKGAPTDKLARAVRHSMVVIDAGKHKLDYKRSYEENGIEALKQEFQKHIDDDGYGGASTLISSAKSDYRIPKRKGQPHINEKGKKWYDPTRPEGALVYQEANELYVDKKGMTQLRMEKSTRMAETDDAHTLSSGTPQENAYADYANYMKDMANKARLELAHTGRLQRSPTAAKTYSEEVSKLNAQLNIALKNAPRERIAQLAASDELAAMQRANPHMSSGEKKKYGTQALTRSRAKFGAHRNPIDITPRDWEAIQAGAISDTTLKEILRFADLDQVRSYATPRATKQLTPAKEARISNLKRAGYTTSQIASALGISASAVSRYLKENTSA